MSYYVQAVAVFVALLIGSLPAMSVARVAPVDDGGHWTRQLRVNVGADSCKIPYDQASYSGGIYCSQSSKLVRCLVLFALCIATLKVHMTVALMPIFTKTDAVQT